MSYDSGHTERESGVFFDGVAEVVPELEVIHSSAVSVVYRSRIDGRRVALKGLPEDKRHDPAALAALRKEYMMLLEVDHPGIVRVFGMRVFPGIGHVIVMEYVEGETLAEMEPEYLSVSQRRRMLTELVEAVAYIHSKGMVHRDIKLSNVMTARLSGHVRLIDFGLADSDGWWIGKQPAGTEGYVSDEQRTSRVPDLCNDVYSLGVVMKKLRPGLIYGGVCRRCLGDVSRRYDSAGTLLRRMRRVWRNYMLTLCVLAIVTAVAILLALAHHESDIEIPRQEKMTELPVDGRPSETQDSAADGISVERIQSPEPTVAEDLPSENGNVDPNQDRIENSSTENNDGEEKVVLPESLIQEAYAAIDPPFQEAMSALKSAKSFRQFPNEDAMRLEMNARGTEFRAYQARFLSTSEREELRKVIGFRICDRIRELREVWTERQKEVPLTLE
mgnify:CR=1 FL=1